MKKMTRILSLLLCLVMVVGALASCKKQEEEGETSATVATVPDGETQWETDENGYVKELTRISIAANNEFYSTDGYHLYNKDQTRLIFFGSPTVKLPDSVIYIEQNAFSSDCF